MTFQRLKDKLKTQSIIGMPTYDLERLIFSKSKENSNITSNNPKFSRLDNMLAKYDIFYDLQVNDYPLYLLF